MDETEFSPEERAKLEKLREAVSQGNNPELSLENPRQEIFGALDKALGLLAEDAPKLVGPTADLSRKQLEADRKRIKEIGHSLEGGNLHLEGNLTPHAPYSRTYGDEKLALLHLDALRYDPTHTKLAEGLMKQLDVTLPDGKTIDSLVADAKDEYNRSYGSSGELRIANDTSDWTFPSKMPGLAVNISHMHASDGTSIRLAVDPARVNAPAK